MSKSKAKGTAAETAVSRWMRDHGFPWTERLALQGAADCGDLTLLPGRAVIVEVKNHATGATGQPPAGLLTDWMRQTETERVNAGADHAALIVKRAGTTDVARWWCYVRLGDLARLDAGERADDVYGRIRSTTVCLDVATWALMLRHGGWGDPPEELQP